MNEPDNPNARPFSAFNLPSRVAPAIAALTTTDISNEDAINNADSSYFETTSVAEEARTLYAYFKASYKFLSASAAYSEAYAKKDTHKSTYVIIENKITGPSLQVPDLSWRAAPRAESLPQDATSEEVFSQFVLDYGTHYIAAVNYGFRIAIRGAVETTDESMRKSFSAALKAKFGGLKAKGGISATEEATLRQANVEIRAVVVSGGVSPANATVLYGYDQISEFLENLKADKVKIKRAPISANANSYWHTLTTYPRSRAVLAEFDGIVATSPFGVPRGTVIAWAPSEDAQATMADGTTRLGVPAGWAICDGTANTPDLRDKFIFGATDLASVKTSGGNESHTHAARNTGSRFEGANIKRNGTGTRRYDDDRISVDATSSIPPFVRLMYLIKL